MPAPWLVALGHRRILSPNYHVGGVGNEEVLRVGRGKWRRVVLGLGGGGVRGGSVLFAVLWLAKLNLRILSTPLV